jgi:hypothetical protein
MELDRLLAGTNTVEDMQHERRSQTRNCAGQTLHSRYIRKFKMRNRKMANAALERAKQLKSAKFGKSQTTTTVKKSAPKKSAPVKSSRSDVPWAKIVKLYNDGKSTKEISDTLGLTRPKNKEGKENPYPYYLVVGYLTKLSHGVDADGQKFSIKRSSRSKK